MNPLSLTLRNCRTYDELHVDLPEGLLAIIGDNGAGKSTLINAIDVALFGPESRSLADWYPRGKVSDDPLQIELVFEHGGGTYRVRRTYSPKGRGQSKTDLDFMALEGDWVPATLESQKETTEQVIDLIGLSRDTFRASSFLAQGDTGRFAEAPARERKRVLAEIVGADDWEPLLERARADKRVAETHLARVAGAIEGVAEEIAQREDVFSELAESQESITAVGRMLHDVAGRLTSARVKLAEAKTGMERRRNAQEAVQRAEHDLYDAHNRIDQLAASLLSLNERLETGPMLKRRVGALKSLTEEQEALRVQRQGWYERERLQNEGAAVMALATSLREKAVTLEAAAQQALDASEDHVCDRCQRPLDAVSAEHAAASYRHEAKQHTDGADKADVKLQTIREALEGLPYDPPDEKRAGEVVDEITQCHEAQRQLAALDELAKRRDEIAEEASRTRAGLPAREQAVAAARAAVEALGPHDDMADIAAEQEVEYLEAEEQNLRAKHAEHIAISARLDERLERIQKIAADAERARSRRDELQTEVGLLTLMEKACGANGVPALILETVAIPQVEVEASRILGLLGGPAYACELRTLREKKTGGIADTLAIILLTETGEAPYETFSGGERARIAFALRLALAQLLANRKGASTGLLVIDEVEGLDAQGMAALVGVLEELQSSIPRIVVVSHNPELRDAFEHSLVLENVDGRSRVVSEVATDA